MSNTTIQLRKSGQTGNTPADLAHGELAINYADGKLFYKNGVGIKSIENQKTFSTVNANNSLIIATTPTDILSLAAGSNILIDTNTVTKTVTISVPGGSSIDTLARDIATNAYNEANTQNVINQTQNTWITNTNTFAQAAFNSANAGVILAQQSYDTANTKVSKSGDTMTGDLKFGGGGGILGNFATDQISLTANVDNDVSGFFAQKTGVSVVYANVDVIIQANTGGATFSQWNFTKDGTLTFPDSTVQNTAFTGYGIDNVARSIANSAFNSANSGVTLATAAYAEANTASGNTVALQSQMTTTNTNITSVNTFAQSGFNSANAGVTLAAAAYDQANNASSNTVYLNEVNTLQNTSITSVNTFAGSAFNSANSGVSLATAAYGKANAEGEINTTQNTWITDTNTFAQAAYNFANTRFSSSGGTISGNVTIQNDLSVLGNVNFIGNVTSITVTGNSGQFFGYASNGHNALYAGIPVGYDFQPHTIFQASSNEDSYSQINIQNINSGANASSDLVATADNGTEDDTYIDMGIGSSLHNDPDYTLVGPNDGYLYVSGNTVTGGGDLVFGTILENDLVFAVGGMNTENEQMRIIGSSNTISIRSNVDSSLAKSVLLGPVANVRITGGSSGQILRTDGAGNLSFINSPIDLAIAAYAQANNASGNTVALQAVNVVQNTNITAVNTFAQTAFNSANAGITLATAAFTAANTASGNTVALQAQMSTTNTNVAAVNTFAASAFNSANAGVTLATAAYAQANNASGNTVALQAVNTTQNTNITSVNTFAGSAFNSANAGVTLATAAFGAANTAAGNTVALQSQMTTTNTNITSVNTFAQAAYNEANGAVQTGFTTISANSINVTPTSNADTLTITAGNNISISACTTTRTITINSTASGGGGGGSGALTYNIAPPATGNTVGDRWVDSEDGTLYTYINDGNSSQWVDFSTAATPASVGGGTANAILYQAGVGNTTFTSVGTQGQLLMAGVGGVPIWAAQTALRIANTQITGLITSGQIATVANTQITGLITNAQLAGPLGVTVTDETANSSTFYPVFSDKISGTQTIIDVSSTKLTYVPSTGTLSSTVITSTSDEKLKTNITTIQNPINIIKQLRGVEYNWKDNGQKSMGVIAQEVEKILPYLVSENENSKAVMYSNMIGLLIEAIKEQQKQIDELRGKLNAD